MIQIDTHHLRLHHFEAPLRIVEMADLISQDEMEGRVVLYRQTLNDMIDEWENDDESDFNYQDMCKLRDIASDIKTTDEDGEHAYPEWYVFNQGENMTEESLENLLRNVQDTVENMNDEEVDLSSGEALDEVFDFCVNSKTFVGYELRDAMMKIDGEEMNDEDCVLFAEDVLEKCFRGDPYMHLFPDNVDYRQDCEEWDERYSPVPDPNEDGDLRFETYEPGPSEALALAEKFAKEQGTNSCQHIWTRLDTDDIVLNGWHMVNRMEYIVCEKPWGNGPKIDDGIYIEAKYS